MTDQLDLFPVDDYADRYYFNPTSTRTKRPIKSKEPKPCHFLNGLPKPPRLGSTNL